MTIQDIFLAIAILSGFLFIVCIVIYIIIDGDYLVWLKRN